MCGIYGTTKIYSNDIIESKLARIKFRGPDNTNYYNFDNKVILGHNRLAIIDLNKRSNQPFNYRHLHITFNGQIYNYMALRDNLKKVGYKFTTQSDTEVICAAYLEYGKECVDKFNGMFSFVIYDQKQNILFGARDRFGQKPFYYTLINDCFEFSSQLASIVINNKFSINENSVNQYLIWNYVHEPESIYSEIYKLEAGNMFTYSLDNKIFKTEKYWDLEYLNNKQVFNYESSLEQLESYIRDAVKIRLISDVPLGVFLSGGIDSSLIAYMAQDITDSPINTFSIKFNEKEFDESIYAEKVSSIIKSNHHTILCNFSEGIELINNIHYYYDEPFADASSIPSMLLAKHTKKHVTVALSGDAGDENFIGYNRYDVMKKWSWFYDTPYLLRIPLSKLINIFKYDKFKLYSSLLNIKNRETFYKRFTSTLNSNWLTSVSEGDILNYEEIFKSNKNFLEKISDFDIKTYLNGDINTKVDRATMAFSLESRSPLMDYRIVEFGRLLPTNFKYQNKNKKRILKDILYKYLPKDLFDRSKSGFSMPLESWFRNDLKEYVLDTLNYKTLNEIPNINTDKVLFYIDEHMTSKHNRYKMIWKLLLLINWQKENNASF